MRVLFYSFSSISLFCATCFGYCLFGLCLVTWFSLYGDASSNSDGLCFWFDVLLVSVVIIMVYAAAVWWGVQPNLSVALSNLYMVGVYLWLDSEAWF